MLVSKVYFYKIGDKINNYSSSEDKTCIDKIKQIKGLSDCTIIDTFKKLKEKELNYIKSITKKVILFNDVNKYKKQSYDGLINPTLNYNKNIKSKKFFFGNKYLIISKKFINKKFNSKEYVFLCVGGSDPLNQLPKLIRWIREYDDKKLIKVVIIKPNK